MSSKLSYTIFWVLVISTNLYFVYSFPLNYFNSKSFNQPFGHLLLLHIVFGMLAILVGPFQFFASIRRNYPRFHRITGRMYLIAVLVAAISAILLAVEDAIVDRHDVVFGTGLLGLAFAWLLTTGMAFWAIRSRNFVQHREWMVKSYVVTCGFTTFRIFASTFPFLQKISGIGGIMAWACWAVPLMVAEALLQAKKINRSRVAARASV
jgi:hypothetical protein